MRLVQNKFFGIVFWVVAFVATVVAAVAGGRAASGSAPAFGESEGAGVGAQFLFGAGGALLAGLAVAAVFVLVWMALWAADRRANPGEESPEDFDTLDDLDDDFDEAERRHDGDEDAADEHLVFERFDDDEPARTH